MIGIGLGLIRSFLHNLYASLTNLFVDENGDHLVDEDGNRLGEL